MGMGFMSILDKKLLQLYAAEGVLSMNLGGKTGSFGVQGRE